MNEKVLEVIGQIAPDKSKKVLADSDLIDQLGFDSVNMLELITNLEEAFDITFEDDHLDLDNFKNVSAILALLGKYDIKQNA